MQGSALPVTLVHGWAAPEDAGAADPPAETQAFRDRAALATLHILLCN